jgi:hypothetical protein
VQFFVGFYGVDDFLEFLVVFGRQIKHVRQVGSPR